MYKKKKKPERHVSDTRKKRSECEVRPERKGERVRSRFTKTHNKQNINGKQMCFCIICRTE